jgi:phage terminase small subunit
MATLQIEVDDDRDNDGPAMSALRPNQRLFVHAMLTTGPRLEAARVSAAAAGYANPAVAGWQLMRNPRVVLALKEEAAKRLVSGALLGVDVLMKIAESDTHKDQFKAAKYLAEINGFTVEQKITVEHVTTDQREVVQRIMDNARIAGQDPAPFLALIGVVDAEFTPVTVDNFDE